MRYMKEVKLLLEVRQILTVLEWDGNRWRELAQRIRQRVNSSNHPSTSPEHNGPLEEGLRAYALLGEWHDMPAFITITDWGPTDENVEVDVGDSK